MLNLYQYANDVSSIFANIPFVLIAYLYFIEYALLDIGSINNNENLKKKRMIMEVRYYWTYMLKGDQNTQNTQNDNIIGEFMKNA